MDNRDGQGDNFGGSSGSDDQSTDIDGQFSVSPSVYEIIFNQSPEGIFIHDAEGHIFDANESVLENLGYTREELLSMKVSDIEVGLDKDVIHERLQAMDTGSMQRVEDGLHRRKDGSTFPVEVWVSKLKTDGRALFVGLSRDITERKEREQELERKRNLLNHTEELAHVGGWEADVETGELRWTEGTYKIHGIEPDSDFDPTVDAGVGFYHPDDQDEIDRLVERCMEKGEQYDVELRLITADDRFRWVRTIGEPIRKDGEIVTIRGAIRDITDRKEREQELQRERDRLDEFAGVVSHDLRNPLNVAEGRLDLAMEDCESEHLDVVAQAHERMDALIGDVLSLARAGESVGEMEPVELAELVEACWQTVETASAELVVETETTIQADATRLQQLFENLVRNAVEHAGEEITITVGDLPDGFYVEDDGPGIPEDERGSIFDAGYSTAADGTGLGLSIVREVAETHGWEIEVTESESGGARFEATGVQKDG